MSLGPAYDTKEQVRQAIDIVDLVGSYIPLRRQGRNFVGLCPWHDDTKPSLQVNQDRQSWKCWVCDLGGDIFSWIERREGIDFREALELLAERAGIELSRGKQPPAKPGSPSDKKTLYQAAAWAEQQFHEHLLHSADAEIARRYLDDRSITSASIERFHLGFSANTWQWLADRSRSTPYSLEVLEAVGLVGRSDATGRYYDRFKGRVIFPIRDTQNRVIAFGGRVLPELAKQEASERNREPAKYVNSPETRLYSKSDQLYALHLALDATSKEKIRRLVVVEGYTDVIMAHQCGVQNVVAVCGTALNERHITLLRRHADTVTLVLDGDEAGQRRTNQILELFVEADIDLRILSLPEELDPFDFLREHGAEPFCEMLTRAVDALEHKVRIELAGVDVSQDTHRANQGLENILATIAKAPRLRSGTTSETRLREQQILSRLARQFRIDEPELRTRLNELRQGAKRKLTRAIASAPPSAAECNINAIDPRVAELIEILILHPELTEVAADEIRPEWLSLGAGQALFAAFCRVHHSGEPAEFQRVMTTLDDARLKNLLVEFDERAHQKAAQTQADAPSRLRGLIETFAEVDEATERREKLAKLEDKNLDEQEQLNILNQLIEQKRNRQGISAPTDG